MRTIHPARNDRRAGFTLIELLVVIAIIAVLVSLTTVAVQYGRGRAVQTQAFYEISSLSNAIANFKQEFGVTYVPSQIKLCKTQAEYGASTLDKHSQAYLFRIFGKRLWSNGPVHWDGVTTTSTGSFTLFADQSLIFWLGGIPDPAGSNATNGFSTDPQNPSIVSGTRRGPYYEFRPNRLQLNNGFYRFIDPFTPGQPYLYFSSYRAANSYDFLGGDSGTSGVAAYKSSASQFVNPSGFQIISAGTNSLFGPGGTSWNPSSGYGGVGVGADDLANFSSAPLGVGIN